MNTKNVLAFTIMSASTACGSLYDFYMNITVFPWSFTVYFIDMLGGDYYLHFLS